MNHSQMKGHTNQGTIDRNATVMDRLWGQQMDAEMQQCTQNCLDCHAICLETAKHCLKMGGKHAAPDHITLLLDCAQICATSADFMLRGSDLHARTCGVCAEICERCAQDCERIADGDAQMLACAQMCRRCADSCRRMAQMM
jgi:hypothetical protein